MSNAPVIGPMVNTLGKGLDAIGNFIAPKAPAATPAPAPPTPSASDPATADKLDQAEAEQRSIRGQAANMLTGGGASLNSSNASVARNVLLGS